MDINAYLIKSKVNFITKAREDFKALYGLEYTPFCRKIYFYFFTCNNRKYVHKESLQFIYSNGGTYHTELNPSYCYLTKQIHPLDIVSFLESYNGNLLPPLLESNEKFLVYDYIEGESVIDVTKEEFYKLREDHAHTTHTPFYNSMTFNLVRDKNDIKLVDLKHFEQKDGKPFFIYMYNKEFNCNKLYKERQADMEPIIKHLETDYPVTQATILEY